MRLTRTLAFRLFLLIASIQTVILIALTFATLRIHQTQLMKNGEASAARVSDVIARSTRYSMLLNRKEDVQHIISSVGGEPGFEGLRIYNKDGRIIFATQPSDIHTKVDMNAEACITCHSSNALGNALGNHTSNSQKMSRIFTKPGGDRVLGLITAIRNEPQCSDAACHAHPPTKTILGVLDVKVNLSTIDAQLAQSRDQLLVFSSGAVLLISLISGAFIWLFVRRPVKKLMHGMEMVSTGDLDHRLTESSSDELGQLAKTYNRMTNDLATARSELTAWSTTLERKVKEKTADLEKAHKQIVTVEKMASLGSLAATVAHELNNPLEGILTFAKLLIKRVRKSSLPPDAADQMSEELKLIADESLRCGNIVKNLLIFARQKGGMLQRVKLKPIVERCLLMMNHHAAMHAVEMHTDCDDHIIAECDPDQIQQALMALMANAIESMARTPSRQAGGKLDIAVHKTDTALEIRVADTGTGMPEDVKAHIFEPFFTTKSEGKGVGLGLAVVYGIVQRHHGHIEVDSVVGSGTTFTIILPITEPAVPETVTPPTREGVNP